MSLLLSLALGCGAPTPTPTPTPNPTPAPTSIQLAVALPSAEHARWIPARQVLWPAPDSQVEPSALCGALSGEDTEAAERLLREGALAFAVIEIDAGHVRVSQEEIASLSGGRFAESELRGSLLPPLYDALTRYSKRYREIVEVCGPVQTASAHTEQWPAVMVAIDASLPYVTARQLFYTAGQAMVNPFYVVVEGSAGAPLSLEVDADARQLVVRFDAERAPQYSRLSRPDASVDGALPAAIAALDAEPLGCGLLSPRPEMSWGSIVQQMDTLGAFGARRFLLAGGDEDAEPSALADGEPTPFTLTLETEVPAFLIELPAIGGMDGPDESAVDIECDALLEPTPELLEAPDSSGPQPPEERSRAPEP